MTVDFIRIDTEFENLIPPLTDDEFSGLRDSILQEGCRDALLLWGDTLVDGHNRYKICRENGIPFETKQKDFATRNDAMLWMMQNQLSRRNLNDAQRIAVVHKCEAAVKAKAQERMLAGKKADDPVEKSSQGKSSKSRDELGRMAGVSGWTYEHASRVLDEAPESVSQAMLSGDLSINKAHEVVKAEPEQQEEIAYRIEHIEDEPEETNTPAKVADEVLKKPHVANNSGNNEWYTPQDIIELARVVMGTIDLDPASCDIANETVQATQYYTKQDSGLEHDWYGNVWMNPPYSSDLIGKFADKLVSELPNVKNAIVLVNNATDTSWFHKMAKQCSAVCFVNKRVKFHMPDGKTGTPLQGQAILYFGESAILFVSKFSEKGWCVYPA